jgi:hypothetical protein
MLKEMELGSGRLNSLLMIVCGLVLALFMLAFFATTMGMQEAIRDGSQPLAKPTGP